MPFGIRLGRGGPGKEGAAAPSGAETFAAQNGSTGLGKSGLRGQDNVRHDPLESTVGVLASMCGKDVARLGTMLDQQYGETPEDPVKAKEKAEVSKRVRTAWGMTDETSGTENTGALVTDPVLGILRMSEAEAAASGDPDVDEIRRYAASEGRGSNRGQE